MDSIDQIVEAVTATAEIMGQQVSATAIALIAEELPNIRAMTCQWRCAECAGVPAVFACGDYRAPAKRLASPRRRGPHSPSQTTIPAW